VTAVLHVALWLSCIGLGIVAAAFVAFTVACWRSIPQQPSRPTRVVAVILLAVCALILAGALAGLGAVVWLLVHGA